MTERILPAQRNPIFEDSAPDHGELVAKRRLGQTVLKAKPGSVGVSNATKPEHLGTFEYAHLKVPLPNSLKGTGMFAAPYPEAYFLMRRSVDGRVSATGMFKATFPWAQVEEEQLERQYIKNLSTTALDEVAGNVWITESAALKLADEYHIRPWIVALLDPATIPIDDKKTISSPPMYKFKANEKTNLPASLASPTKARVNRAGSPSKKDASPRKRVSKATKEANATTARQASEALQSALDAASVRSVSVEPTANGTHSPPTSKPTKKRGKKADKDAAETVAKAAKPEADKNITVDVQTTIQTDGDQQTEQTTVKVTMPDGVSELPPPENMEQVIADAKKMVEEARALEQNGDVSTTTSKRKAEVLDAEDDAEEIAETDTPEIKRIKLAEQQTKKRTILSRALAGVAVSLAIGAVIPYALGG